MGYVQLKEKGYIPTNMKIRSGTVSYHAGRYFVSVLIDMPEPEKYALTTEGLGIDLGIKTFATCSNGMAFENINYSKKIRKLEKQIKREQRSLSRKYENAKKSKKGEATYKNIEKQKLKIAKLYYRLDCIRSDYTNKCINELVKTKPAYIALENLNVSGMLKNKHLSHAISQLGFYTFRVKLINVCSAHGIPVRLINRWYPSSKTCHNCDNIKHDLTLKDRIYKCPVCGYTIDRDLNAAFNIRDCMEYKYVC